jgi:plasmid recombination enzyme
MKELGVTFHCGSGKNAIKSEKDLKSIDAHNNRKYKNKNNQELDPEKSHENVVIVGTNNIIEDVKKVYKDEFSEAVYDYNMKQKREDRKILDYYNRINNDKQTNLAVEMIFQLGDSEHWKDKSMEDKKKMVNIYSKAVDILKDRNIITAQATVHLDESSPHLHLIAVPIADNNKRGLNKQVSQNKVLTIKAIKEIREEIEKVFISEYKKTYKEEITLKKGSELPDHLDVKKYKKAKEILKVAKEYEYNQEIKDTIENELENVKEEIKEIKEKLNKAETEKENKIEEIEDVKKETNKITNELTKLETTKNGKLKEKDDLEKALDLYQQKIKDYKEQIVKDKEEADRLEEEEKKTAEDLKAQEKKIKDIKDEIDKKNKDYNDSLTEKNNLEEKKKKLEEDKKNIENAYNLEKENIIKDSEEKRKALLKEKADLENDITNIKEFIITQKSIKNEREQEAEDYKKIKEESEKLQKDKKETQDLINSLKVEKSRLESEKDELKDIVQAYIEKQKDYNSILTPALKEITKEEKKKEIIETVKDTIVNEYDSINIKLEMKGILDHESRYNKEYKLSVEAIKDNKKVSKEILTAEEKENLAYNLASANYTLYSNNFDKMEINYNTGDGKTKVEVLHHYTEKDKIEFEPTRLDNFIILIKEKVNDFKNAIVDSLKQKFGYTNIEKDNYFNREQDKKNNNRIDIEY